MSALRLQAMRAALNKVILGKEQVVDLALCCLLAGGHVLLEDPPGMGKTTLAHALAMAAGLSFRRLQCTSDLLPADVTGYSRFRQDTQKFEFLPGPVFTQVLLADELNRASPKTQSALLEAMEEGQVSLDGISYRLPEPFWVIATQNPQTQTGTYALPESQLDRFMMRLQLGYPDPRAERALLLGSAQRRMVLDEPLCSLQDLEVWRKEVMQVHTSDALMDYLLALLRASRTLPEFRHGLSPRAGQALRASAQAKAWLSGRDHVLPDDVQQILASVVNHRLPAVESAARLLSSIVPVLP